VVRNAAIQPTCVCAWDGRRCVLRGDSGGGVSIGLSQSREEDVQVS
jgi:hypothetical protein